MLPLTTPQLANVQRLAERLDQLGENHPDFNEAADHMCRTLIGYGVPYELIAEHPDLRLALHRMPIAKPAHPFISVLIWIGYCALGLAAFKLIALILYWVATS